VVEQQEVMDKEEQPRSSARIASQTSVDYAEPRRDSTWTDGEVQALACMLYTNKLKVGRFGPATVQHLVEMGKVWFLIHVSYSYFLHFLRSQRSYTTGLTVQG
jgi:hypothetical protein